MHLGYPENTVVSNIVICQYNVSITAPILLQRHSQHNLFCFDKVLLGSEAKKNT